MRNWSTDAPQFKKKNPEGYAVWKLEQQVNFGLAGGGKINETALRKYFTRLQIDPDRKKLFSILLQDEK